MKKIIIIIFIISLSVSVFGIETIAIALKVKGEIDINRKDKSFAAKTGEQLLNYDTLESKLNAFAAIKFIDGNSIIKLFPNSILTLSADKDGNKLNKKSYLDFGKIWAKVVNKTGDFEIDTPTTIISVKGTEFLLEINETGATQLLTIEGIVNIKNKKDDREVNLEAGQKAFSDGDGEIVISKIEKDELEQIDELDKAEKTLEIEVENEQGETKIIKIRFE